MPIAIACAQCDWKGKVADSNAGKKGKCPTCGEGIKVPTLEAEPDDVESAAAAALLEGDDDTPSGKPYSYQTPQPYSLGANDPPKPIPTPKPERRAVPIDYKPKERERRSGLVISAGVVQGLLMMGGAAIWFFLGLAADRIFFYPPILFVIGIVRLVGGLTGNED
jgi:hypothetical protein